MGADIGNLAAVLPNDEEGSAKDAHYLFKLPELAGTPLPSPLEFLDLGAGHGRSKGMAENAFGAENVKWRGVDIDSSDEHLSRPDDAPPVDIYDGMNLPYADAEFDVIWCKQVLEHVRHPDSVIGEVSRTLKPGGWFIGSVSQMEPYHSRSIFNWTHYGVRVVFKDHGLDVVQLSPGADGLLMMMRSVFGHRTGLNAFFRQETPFNQILDALFSDTTYAEKKPHPKAAMLQKIKTAGHLHFAARKT